MKITRANIIDYIGDELRKGRTKGKRRKFFRWTPEEWQIFRDIVWATTCHIITGEGGVEAYEGMSFMGVKHYIKN